MSTPYPPQAPRTLLRNPAHKMLGGVCAGVADYLNMDVTLVRILTVLLSLFTGVPVILYVVALFVVPEGTTPPVAPPTVAPTAPTPSPAPSPGPMPTAPDSDPDGPADLR